jgi:hypothetical protein
MFETLRLPFVYQVILQPFFDAAYTYDTVWDKGTFHSFTLFDQAGKHVCTLFNWQTMGYHLNSPFMKGEKHHKLRLLDTNKVLALLEGNEVRYQQHTTG